MAPEDGGGQEVSVRAFGAVQGRRAQRVVPGSRSGPDRKRPQDTRGKSLPEAAGIRGDPAALGGAQGTLFVVKSLCLTFQTATATRIVN